MDASNDVLNPILQTLQQPDAATIGGLAGVLLLILIFVLYRRMQRSAPMALEADSQPDEVAPEPLFERSLTPAEAQPASQADVQPSKAEPAAVERNEAPAAPAMRPSASDLSGSIIEKAAQLSPEARSVETAKPSVATRPTSLPAIPEDSVLRRHYLANLKAQREAITNPYPSDSVLRRHYDTLHRLEVGAASAPVAVVAEATATAEPASPVARLPQDSVLRRHFIADLRARIEAGLSPRPTDAVLRRHYETLVNAELYRQLESLGA